MASERVCGDATSHGPHEWYDRALRVDCPGVPDRSAPDALVETLAGAVCECGHLARYHDDMGCRVFPDRQRQCECRHARYEALAPTVQAYAEQVAAERLAGVEALATDVRYSDEFVGNALRAALSGGGEQ